MKYLFVIESLQIGGAEKLLIDFAAELSRSANVSIFAFYDGPLRHDLSSRVNFCTLNGVGGGNVLNRIIGRVRRYFFIFAPNYFPVFKRLQNFDVAVSFLEGVCTKIVERIEARIRICWIHTQISKSNNFNLMARSNLEFYDRIIFPSKVAREDFRSKFSGVEFKKTIVIQNCINTHKINELSKLGKVLKGAYTLSVGRLVAEKRYDALLELIAATKIHSSELKHYIIGSGPLAQDIIFNINSLGLNDIVVVLGEKINPYPYMRYATAVISMGDSEGFGLVVAESVSLKVPVLASDNPINRELKEIFPSITLFSTPADFRNFYGNKVHSFDVPVRGIESFTSDFLNLINEIQLEKK